MCDEFPLEYEESLSQSLNNALEEYIDHNYTTNHVVSIITSYIFCNEYYFRRDCHFINTNNHMTLYLYKSKQCKHLFKLTVPIRGHSFTKFINSTPIHNKLSAWIDTECKDDSFSNSKAANMKNGSYFLLMTYFEESRQHITPWLAQWQYTSDSMPFIQVISRIVSYPSNWNYVTIAYEPRISCVFYTSTEQHTIEFIADDEYNSDSYKERVSVIKFAKNVNYPWLMFGSA